MKTEEEKPKDSPEEREVDAHRGHRTGLQGDGQHRAKWDPKEERAMWGNYQTHLVLPCLRGSRQPGKVLPMAFSCP